MAIDVEIALPGNEGPTVEDARRLVAEAWGLAAEATVLGGWEDSNFRINAPEGHTYVLKISPPETRRETLENQASMLLHLAAGELASLVPRVVPTIAGQMVHPVELGEGPARWARLLTYLDGLPLVGMADRPSRLLSEIGSTLARLDLELSAFDHPATRTTHEWDLMATPNLTPFARHIDDPVRRALAKSHLERFSTEVLPHRSELEHGVIHADANDHNLLVNRDENGPRLSGIIDFSDLLHSPVIADLGISLAYLMLDRDDPFAEAGHLIRGYNTVRPLTDLERRLLPELVVGRICTSVLHAAHGLARDPGNTYLQISAAPMWRLLEGLATSNSTRFSHTVETACR